MAVTCLKKKNKDCIINKKKSDEEINKFLQNKSKFYCKILRKKEIIDKSK